MSPSKLYAPPAAVVPSWRAQSMEFDQSIAVARSSHTYRNIPSVDELLARLADIWVPAIILFILPPCIIIGLIISFPNYTFPLLSVSMLGLWGFTNYTVRAPLLREKMGVSSIMAVHGHYFCYCLLYGIINHGNDDSWIDYAVKALGFSAVLPLAVLFLWSVDPRRWNREHPHNDTVLCIMFPVIPLLNSYSALPCNADSPEKVEMLEDV